MALGVVRIFAAGLQLPGDTARAFGQDAAAQCVVASGTFAIMVQVFLGASSFVALVLKRHYEYPKRSFTIWFMDSAKQGFALVAQHAINILLALALATGNTKASECMWYGTNVTIAVICGIFWLSRYMRVHRWMVQRYRLFWLESGNYGPPDGPPKWKWWLAQMCLWIVASCGEKLLTAVVVILPLHHKIDWVIAHLKESMKLNPKFELVLNMVIVPSLLNICFVWVMDNLIMKSSSAVIELTTTVAASNAASMLSARLSAAEGGGRTPTLATGAVGASGGQPHHESRPEA